MRYTFLEKNDKDQVIFKGGKLEIYIPKDYFKEEIAESHGMRISTIGIFIMKYYSDVESSKYKTYQMYIPENIFFSYSEKIDSVKEVLKTNVTTNGDDEDEEENNEDTYTVFILYENDVFIENTKIARSIKNTEEFVKLHQGARIPSIVEYSKILNLYLENTDTNGIDLEVPSAILEMQISELCRYKKDLNIPFRKAITTLKNVTELDYTQVSIKNLAMLNSTFTAITSEDINAAITAGVSKSRTDGIELDTPIEPVSKY